MSSSLLTKEDTVQCLYRIKEAQEWPLKRFQEQLRTQLV